MPSVKHILVEKVEPQSKGNKNWLKITYHDDGKEFAKHIFPNVEGYKLLVPGKIFIITSEKNEASGYWDVLSVEPAPAPTPVAPGVPIQDNSGKIIPEQKAPAPTSGGYVREDPIQRSRSMAVAYAKDLVEAGKVELGDLPAVAEYLHQYISGNVKVSETTWVSIFLKLDKRTNAVPQAGGSENKPPKTTKKDLPKASLPPAQTCGTEEDKPEDDLPF